MFTTMKQNALIIIDMDTFPGFVLSLLAVRHLHSYKVCMIAPRNTYRKHAIRTQLRDLSPWKQILDTNATAATPTEMVPLRNSDEPNERKIPGAVVRKTYIVSFLITQYMYEVDMPTSFGCCRPCYFM